MQTVSKAPTCVPARPQGTGSGGKGSVMMWAGVRLRPGHVLAAEPAEVGVLSLEDTSLPSNNCQELFSPDRTHRLLQPHSGQVGAFPDRTPVLARLPKTPPCHFICPHLPFKVTACLQRLQLQVSEAHSFLPPSSPFVEYQVSQVGVQGAGASWGLLKGHPWPPSLFGMRRNGEDSRAVSIPWASSAIFHPSPACRSHSQQQWVWWGASLGCQPDVFFQGAIPGCFG